MLSDTNRKQRARSASTPHALSVPATPGPGPTTLQNLRNLRLSEVQPNRSTSTPVLAPAGEERVRPTSTRKISSRSRSNSRSSLGATKYKPPPKYTPIHPEPTDDPPSYSTAVGPRFHKSVPIHRARPRVSSADFTSPISTLLISPLTPVPKPPTRKSSSSPHLSRTVLSFPPPLALTSSTPASPAMSLDSEEDRDEDDDMIYTSWSAQHMNERSTTSLRTRLFGAVVGGVRSREKLKAITTAPGVRGAGETETEADEPPNHLPTARKQLASKPIVPPSTLQQLLTPLLFQALRLLAIVPAVFGTIYNLAHAFHEDLVATGRPDMIDYLVSALWAILTGYQCLALATGLLVRWRVYYPSLATLIRLLALQAICWPATHLTLTILGHAQRPAICWAVVGTFTCVSRSVQLWVTSNLWWEREAPPEGGKGTGWRRFGGGKWGGRRWDWGEVWVKCALPAGIVYFIMAWAGALRREWGGC